MSMQKQYTSDRHDKGLNDPRPRDHVGQKKPDNETPPPSSNNPTGPNPSDKPSENWKHNSNEQAVE